MNEGTYFVETRLPCPCGESSDAYALNADNSGKCFSCGKFFASGVGSDGGILEEETYIVFEDEDIADAVSLEYVSHWRISKRTFEYYNVFTKVINGQPTTVAFEYPNGAIKGRKLYELVGGTYQEVPKNRSFFSVGPISETHLFGENVFDPGSRDSITITEGEKDALAVHEMVFGQTAAVSVRNAATAFGDVKARRDYINSFKKIILCLDNDKAGQQATRQITTSGIFDYEKLYIVNLGKHKDAAEYIATGSDGSREFLAVWEAAKRYTPSSIINSFNDIREALNRKEAERICDYPFEELNNALKGLHRGEFILLKGLEKLGKTEICRAICHEALQNSSEKVATIFLEESEDETIHGVATYQLGYPTNLGEGDVDLDEVVRGYSLATGGDETKLYIHSHFTTEDEDEIVDNIRFLVTVAGCSLVLLDNLTMLVTGREGEDERLRIDRIVRRLRDLVNELHFCLVLVAHVNDTGQTRGSRLPDKICNTIISIDRNKLAPIMQERNLVRFMVEGSRKKGTTMGPAGAAFFDPISFKLRDVTQEDNLDVPDLDE